MAASPYDYSQPIVVNNYIPVDGGTTAGATAEAAPATAPSGDVYAVFSFNFDDLLIGLP